MRNLIKGRLVDHLNATILKIFTVVALSLIGIALALGGSAHAAPVAGVGADTKTPATGARVDFSIGEAVSRPLDADFQPPQKPFATPTTPRQAPAVTGTPTGVLEQQTADLINQRRVALGLNPLRVDVNLVAAARRHSNDIGPHGLCQHEGTDGTSPWDRIDQSGYTGFGNGEVVGCGYDTPQSVVDAWWGSPGHYDILVAPDTNDIGCGWWLDSEGYGWQTCDTGISDSPTATRGPSFTPTRTRTRTATRTATPVVSQTATRTSTRAASTTSTTTRTATRVTTATQTNTPGAATGTPTPTAMMIGHVIWQGRPAQPNALQQMPITLTLKSDATEVNYTVRNTNINGYFTVPLAGLANGNYTWRAKGPLYLANSGNVTLSGAPVVNVEMGLLRSGDSNNDNIVTTLDLNILKLTLGRGSGDPGYDSRSDFTGDNRVTSPDYIQLRLNIGLSGAPPIVPGGR